MALPESAEPYWLQQQAVNAAAVAVAARSWQYSGGNPARWAAMLPFVMAAILRAQVQAAAKAVEFIAAAVGELSIGSAPLAAIDTTPLIGLSGAGLPLEPLYAQLPDQLALRAARVSAEDPSAVVEPLTWSQMQDLPSHVFRRALDGTAQQLTTHVQTTISDTGRAAESLEIAVRPGVGYVRMLNPPSCKRCVVLAGKLYRWSADFKRHPGCDCRHVPGNASVTDELRVDPKRYFRSLTAEEQDEAFTKAGAQAIRDGADISQVVNADKGMQTAQVYGRALKITTQGVTKRGKAGRAIRARGRTPATTPRLMPSTIYRIAEDRYDALRLLRMNGYIADTDPGVVDLDAI